MPYVRNQRSIVTIHRRRDARPLLVAVLASTGAIGAGAAGVSYAVGEPAAAPRTSVTRAVDTPSRKLAGSATAAAPAPVQEPPSVGEPPLAVQPSTGSPTDGPATAPTASTPSRTAGPAATPPAGAAPGPAAGPITGPTTAPTATAPATPDPTGKPTTKERTGPRRPAAPGGIVPALPAVPVLPVPALPLLGPPTDGRAEHWTADGPPAESPTDGG